MADRKVYDTLTELASCRLWWHSTYMRAMVRASEGYMNKFFLTRQSGLIHWFYFMRVNQTGAVSIMQVTDDFGNLVDVGSESTRRSLRD